VSQKGNEMKKTLEGIGNYMQFREIVLSFLLTEVFMLVSFVGYTRFSTTEITATIGGVPETHEIRISYYGFPFEMIGVLNPFGIMENYWVSRSGEGLVRIIWRGIFTNFVLYFLLAFLVVYLFRRLSSR